MTHVRILVSIFTELTTEDIESIRKPVETLGQDAAQSMATMMGAGLCGNGFIALTVEPITKEQHDSAVPDMPTIAETKHSNYDGIVTAIPVEVMEQLEEIRNRHKSLTESGLLVGDEYQRGLYNGTEEMLAGLENRQPILLMPDGSHQLGKLLED